MKKQNFGKFTTDKSWIDYSALTKIGLPANTEGPCNTEKFEAMSVVVCVKQAHARTYFTRNITLLLGRLGSNLVPRS